MQDENVAVEAPQEESGGTPPAVKVTVPEAIHATCPGCGADPLKLKRIRHDFPDGVVVEVLFCSNQECRIAIGAQIVGIEKPRK